MRKLPHELTMNQKIILEATKDFYGEGYPRKMKEIRPVALWLMGRRKGNKLTEEQQEAVWHIRNNLADQTYRQNLLKALNFNA